MSDPKTELPERVCKVCDQVLDYSKPDPCLGWLPGVDSACCGHGEADMGYIGFENGVVIHFDTMEILDWNTPVKDADLDPVSGGVWSSSLNPTVFRSSYTGSCKQRIMMVRFIRQVLNGWPFIGFRDIFTKD